MMKIYTNINIFHIKHIVKVMGYTLLQTLIAMLILGCSSFAAPISIQVIHIENAKASDTLTPIESQSCQHWKMSSDDVEIFFNKSLSFKETHYNIFDIYPCSISGKVQFDNKIWDFNINESGWTELHSGSEKIYIFGCIENDPECHQELEQFKGLEK